MKRVERNPPKKRKPKRRKQIKLAPTAPKLEDVLKRPVDESLRPKKMPKLPDHLAAQLRASGVNTMDAYQIFAPSPPPPGIKGAVNLAMDSNVSDMVTWAIGNVAVGIAEGQMFYGYPLLAVLAQRAEYRKPVEIIGTEMTREWIELKSKGEDVEEKDEAATLSNGTPEGINDNEEDEISSIGKDDALPGQLPSASPDELGGGDIEDGMESEEDIVDQKKLKKINEIRDEMVRLRVRECFQEAAQLDGFFGRAHIYIDLGTTDNPGELAIPIVNKEGEILKAKIKKGSLKALRPVEPMWVYPQTYNAIDPLKDNWYKPETWYIQSRPVHESRLLTFIGRKVPDLLKPAYMFGGLPITQMLKPYVDNWLRTRQSVSDLIHSFSVFVLSTDMNVMMSGPNEMLKRADVFNSTRDNRGLMIIDKENEEFHNVQARIADLSSLQAQSQEHMSSVVSIPLIKMFGIVPTGLNNNADSEIRVFYDWVKAYQEHLFRDNLKRIIDIIQLHLYGSIDDDITFEFLPLWSLDEKSLAEMNKAQSETDDKYVQMGVIDPREVRERLANDPNSGYDNIDINDMPDPPPDPMEQGLLESGAPGEGGPGAEGASAAGPEEPEPSLSKLKQPMVAAE